MPSLIGLGPPSKLFISGTLVYIEILIQMLKNILQTIIFLLYYTEKDCTVGCFIVHHFKGKAKIIWHILLLYIIRHLPPKSEYSDVVVIVLAFPFK